jgi:hypothetical protein
MTEHIMPPTDKRQKHANHPHAMLENSTAMVDEHIRSFPWQKSYYSCHGNMRYYYLLPGLNVKKMHSLYLQKAHGGQ